MKIFMKAILIVVALQIAIILLFALAGCGDNVLTKSDACDEQATAWCERLGYDSTGCPTVYRQWCMLGGANAAVDADAQDECLRAIASSACDDVPDECKETW